MLNILNKYKYRIFVGITLIVGVFILYVIQYNIFGGAIAILRLEMFSVFAISVVCFFNKLVNEEKESKKPNKIRKIVEITFVVILFISTLVLNTYNLAVWQFCGLSFILLVEMIFPNWSNRIKNNKKEKVFLIAVVVICITIICVPLASMATLDYRTVDETQSVLERENITNVEFLDSVSDETIMNMIFDGEYSEVAFYLFKGTEDGVEYCYGVDILSNKQILKTLPSNPWIEAYLD